MHTKMKWTTSLLSVLQMVIGPQFVLAQSMIAPKGSVSPRPSTTSFDTVRPSQLTQNGNFQLQGSKAHEGFQGRNVKDLTVPGAMATGAAPKEGPIATGGGEHQSQSMRSMIESLPSVLRAKGLHYFPEVDITKLEDKIKSKILIESESNIKINGASKGARFDRIRNMIFVDQVEWNKLDRVAKLALAFHEVLGLMGLEGNDDYDISNRLLALEHLALSGVKAAVNQILPTNFNDPQVIYWSVTPERQISFFYCSDRNVISTCRILGGRSYSVSEIMSQATVESALQSSANQRLKAAQDRLAKKRKLADNLSESALWNLGIGLGVALVGVVVPPLGAVIPFAIAEAFGGAFILGASGGGYHEHIDAKYVQPVRDLEAQANDHRDQMNLLNSLAKNETQMPRADIREMANYLNKALLKIPVSKKLN